MRHSAAVVSAEAPDFIEKGTVAKKDICRFGFETAKIFLTDKDISN